MSFSVLESILLEKHSFDYGLRTSLAKDVEGQMSIVTQFTRRFGIFKKKHS